MCKLNKKSGLKRIDHCMKECILNLQSYGMNTLACCCGHGKYMPSIVAKDTRGNIFELLSNVEIPRKKRFYKRDKQGYYYISEVVGKTTSVAGGK